MQEYTAPGVVTVGDDDNVASALLTNARRSPTHPALAYRVGDAFVDVSTADFVARVRALAAGLVALGIEPGDRVCIFMKTRIEFTYLDYAVWFAGATTVTIYETSSADQVEWIVGDSGSKALFCGNDELRARFDEVADRLPDCAHVYVADTGGLDELARAGDGVDGAEIDARIAAISHDDLATLVYTSGTTGRPKGCQLTHGNLIWEVRQVVSRMEHLFTPDGSTLMFLPLAHILARVVQVGCVTRGVRIGYSSGIAQLVPELGMFKPTWVFAVPRVFEKVYNTAQGKAGDGVQRTIFDRATDVAIEYSRQRTAGSMKLTTRVEHALYNTLVYGKLKAAFGGRLQFAISGGAPLGERLGHFFAGAGVLVLEGYGLTETTAAATVNTPGDYRIGTVGRPIPGASVGIADDGEVLLRGGMIFRGYWNNPAATADVMLDDSWFATGDIGELDDQGYLRITGRKKELIVTAAGKNVAPAVLEDAVRAHPLVSQVLVVGDQKPFIAALVTLDVEELAKWAETTGAHASAPGELARELLDDEGDVLRDEVARAIDDANARVSRAESIREFRILSRDFTIESGELTPTMKLKRTVVMANHEAEIVSIYGD
ncbi:MAG: long-chain fatty acid--CoA ligase [Acidimicrobiia bacterium]|nr:long-chain fatty acid--CoA ligase [Acidimicrobiia bacterium]